MVLSPSLQDELKLEMGAKTWEDGERVQGRDQPARGLYLIESGNVRFTNVRSDGREVDSGMLAPGEWFGYISLLSGLPPPHEAYAVGRTRLSLLPAQRFHSLIATDHELTISFLRYLATSAHQLFVTIDNLRSLSTRSIVAKWLLILADRQGKGGRIEIDQETLARQLGLTRVTVGKVLRDFAEAKAIQQGYGWIQVIDSNALASLE